MDRQGQIKHLPGRIRASPYGFVILTEGLPTPRISSIPVQVNTKMNPRTKVMYSHKLFIFLVHSWEVNSVLVLIYSSHRFWASKKIETYSLGPSLLIFNIVQDTMGTHCIIIYSCIHLDEGHSCWVNEVTALAISFRLKDNIWQHWKQRERGTHLWKEGTKSPGVMFSISLCDIKMGLICLLFIITGLAVIRICPVGVE